MKKSEALLAISNKLQKQMHLINTESMRDNPKMLCDNLAARVITELEKLGLLSDFSWEKEEEDEIE